MRCGAKFLGSTVESIVEENNLKPFKNDFWKCDCKGFIGQAIDKIKPKKKAKFYNEVAKKRTDFNNDEMG